MISLDRTLSDSSPISALLDMIARKAPLMMKVGGGPLITEAPEANPNRLSKHEKSMITRRLHQGKSLMQISREYSIPIKKLEPYADYVCREKWSEEEENKLREYYATTPPKNFSREEIAHRLDRSVISVSKRASDLGITNARREKSTAHVVAMRAAKAVGITRA